MSEAQNWQVHYLQNGDAKLERTRLLSSRHDALVAACALQKRHTVQRAASRVPGCSPAFECMNRASKVKLVWNARTTRLYF